MRFGVYASYYLFIYISIYYYVIIIFLCGRAGVGDGTVFVNHCVAHRSCLKTELVEWRRPVKSSLQL